MAATSSPAPVPVGDLSARAPPSPQLTPMETLGEKFPSASRKILRQLLEKLGNVDAVITGYECKRTVIQQDLGTAMRGMPDFCTSTHGVQLLIQFFPFSDETEILEVLEVTEWDIVEAAVALSFTTDINHASTPLLKLSSLFPNTDIMILQKVIDENQHASDDVLAEAVLDALHKPEVAALPHTSAPIFRPRRAQMTYSRDELDEHQGELMPYPVDFSQPAQSFLCFHSLRHLLRHLPTLNAKKDLMDSFQFMVHREQIHHADHVVFYHLYNSAAILYEVQSVIAHALRRHVSVDLPPLPRLLKKPFDRCPEMAMLKDSFASMRDKDHNPEFRAVALSVSCSLFAQGSSVPPLKHFAQGYCSQDISLRAPLVHLLQTCGLGDKVDAVVAELLEVSQRYGLSSHLYSSDRVGARCAAFGHMLQIFVHKDVVNSIAYRSHSLGVPIESSHPMSHWMDFASGDSPLLDDERVREAVNGQARLFVHPDVLLDGSRSVVYHYSASPAYSSKGDGEGSRAAYLRELRGILEPILGTPEACQRTFRGVESLGGPEGEAR